MIYKRGKIWWYKFLWDGELIRESTKQRNDRVARQMESAHRASLAKGLVGIRDKTPMPALSEFCKERFEPWARASFEQACRNNWLWYRAGVRALLAYRPLASARLGQIRSEQAADFAAHRQAEGLQVSTVNSALRVLRRILRLANEWGVLEVVPKIHLLPGECHRERVVSSDEENRYIAAAAPLVADVVTVLADTGLRPDECYRLCWEAITWVNGRNGSLLVTHGKTEAARRVLPMTPRVRAILEERWQRAGKPLEGWIWPAPTRSGHIDHSSLKKQHTRALKLSGVRPFVLYSFRHTFLTRLGASGCDVWTLARIAGHSSIEMSKRYVHPSEEVVLTAMGRLSGEQDQRLGGHNFGHSVLQGDGSTSGAKLLSDDAVYNYTERARSSAG